MNHFVLFHHKIAKKFDEIATAVYMKPEIGGILVGSKRKDNIEVMSLTFPGPTDVSKLMSFIKKDERHQSFALKQWKLFSKTRTYMGEWHTHPAGSPIPSETDFATWISVTKKQKRNMVFVIISPAGWKPYLVVYHLTQKKPVFAMKIEERGETGITYSIVNNSSANGAEI